MDMAYRWIAMEAGALERRLEAVPGFAETIPMVGAAVPAASALSLADATVHRSKRVLRRQLREFRRALSRVPRGAGELPNVHRRLVGLRHRFHALLGTIDIFSDALTQRAEHGVGVLLRGLDALAHDGMRTQVPFFAPPPIVCYLDRGVGGAVRRAFTRLPGGERNAVALVRLPRERLSGLGLSSLLHEVGHQVVASLRLAGSYRRALLAAVAAGELERDVGAWWVSKLTEVLPDAWACAKLGATGTLGLFSVLSSLSRFVFHDDPEDPHPMPYVRGLFSAAIGAELFPDRIWERLRAMWCAIHPVPDTSRARIIERLASSVSACARAIATHRPAEIQTMTLAEAVGNSEVAPAVLRARLHEHESRVRRAPHALSPCVALAVVGLCRVEGRISTRDEHDVLAGALRAWAEHPAT